MCVTVDTNLVVSAFLWGGNPSRVLAAARVGVIDIYTTRALLAELTVVLSRDKFEQRLIEVNSSVSKIIDEYKAWLKRSKRTRSNRWSFATLTTMQLSPVP